MTRNQVYKQLDSLLSYFKGAFLDLVTLRRVVIVRVDACLDRVFMGTALRIVAGAENALINIQTKEDQTRVVYTVVIGVSNPDLVLKPGMIATVESERRK